MVKKGDNKVFPLSLLKMVLDTNGTRINGAQTSETAHFILILRSLQTQKKTSAVIILRQLCNHLLQIPKVVWRQH
jgi:hypothetical protein